MGLPIKMNPFTLRPTGWAAAMYCHERRLIAIGNRIAAGK